MMKQYLAIRRDLPPKTFLLFRLGDFYEMFGEDAQRASQLLNVALTKRGSHPMCGVPFHAAKSYIEKLVAAGYRVALCEQVGEVKAGKLVRREVTRILSPGTLEDFGLDDKRPNYLAAFCRSAHGFGLATCELSTGQLRLTTLDSSAALRDELSRLEPSETLFPDDDEADDLLAGELSPIDSYLFSPDQAIECLTRHFGVQSIDGFGCNDMPDALRAAGALLAYVARQLRRNTDHIRSLRPYRTSAFVHLDACTQSHLELTQSRGGRTSTLLGVLDRTLTPMGGRTLRSWVLRPLLDAGEIRSRQDVLALFLREPRSLEDLQLALKDIRDLERCLSRLNGSGSNPRDLSALGSSLRQIPSVRRALLERHADPGEFQETPPAQPPELIGKLADDLQDLPELCSLLADALVDEPPALLRDGGLIRDGYDGALDELRAASKEGKQWIAELQEREIARTGIKSLKVKFTSVFGYFIEVTKANLPHVPDDYIRKQTTANSERFITPDLKSIEGKILGCDERGRAREMEIFGILRARCLEEMDSIQRTAESVGRIDALASLAECARQRSYTRPIVDTSGLLEIRDGRHPVLDAQPGGETFVPNDTDLDQTEQRLAIITGPNMAGKSTYIRQVALLTLLAQIGSYLPAASARIGMVDRIFTRVGASDDITRGQSTFMVEMNETAAILNNATPRSLVILDEIGRGTSTFDGLSIAWSVAEFLHNEAGCRTLFATHYHEMTAIEKSCRAAVNLNVAVREWNDRVIFLRKIQPGRADQSYGIQVARLAGLPEPVLQRAREILTNLEQAEINADGQTPFAAARRKKQAASKVIDQLELL